MKGRQWYTIPWSYRTQWSHLAMILVSLRFRFKILEPPSKNKFMKKFKILMGRLIVKEYPTKTASTQTIRNHLEKLRMRSIDVDFIIVDYGDLLRPVRYLKEKRNELESIYEELRGIAAEYEAPVWTASQTNRSGLNAEVITMESISEAFNKCFIADFIFTISRTIDDKVANSGTAFRCQEPERPRRTCVPPFSWIQRMCVLRCWSLPRKTR